MEKIKQLITEYNNAQRMLNYADNELDIELAISIMHSTNKLIKAYRLLDKSYNNLPMED